MGKRNWSNSEPSVRKPHAAHMAVKGNSGTASDVVSSIDFALVMAAFASKSDPDRMNYTPVIVNRRIVR